MASTGSTRATSVSAACVHTAGLDEKVWCISVINWQHLLGAHAGRACNPSVPAQGYMWLHTQGCSTHCSTVQRLMLSMCTQAGARAIIRVLHASIYMHMEVACVLHACVCHAAA